MNCDCSTLWRDGRDEKMVERTSGKGLDEFVGFARVVDPVQGNFGPQIKIEIEPENKDLIKAGKTGRFHEFLRLPSTASENKIPEGSVIDSYLREVESLFKEAKAKETLLEALRVLLDKKILWRRKVLGKRYKGYEASEHWVPVRLE